MQRNPARTSAICHRINLLIGVGMCLIGCVVIPRLPWFQLDVVLSPKELADPQKRHETLMLLERASGNQWRLYTTFGSVVTVVSAIGLYFAQVHQHASSNSEPTD